ncbi:ABC transporter [Spraguea lophii 42_110]|uniref:ABC transporter n=1 Tax=Spraguea lophii (strain 42_110) TaxID=1358809 RepID=S7W893_SPRLO|nr:ABC transporter [Spraguea lophii 42_110]
MDISWQNIYIFVPNNGKTVAGKYAHLIKDCSGKARKGKLMAIMGPSGSGKTTLLKALVGRIPPGSKTNGAILGDGEERDLNSWIARSGYIDQDDNVFESSTVYDTILYAAKFRSPDQKNIEETIQKILKDLKIDNIAYNKMDSISGGERKRTMIAVELVSNPDLIFLDEPTSGLDSYLVISFIKLLKEYASKSGKTIIFTIHQPPQEAFRSFDDLLLLARGETIYCGEANKCEEFFNTHGFTKIRNLPFSDFILELLIRENIDSSPIQAMIRENNLKYAGHDLKYKERKNNDASFDFKFNLNHIKLLVKRRFSFFTFSKRKIIGYLYRMAVTPMSIINYYTFRMLSKDKESTLDKALLCKCYTFNYYIFLCLFVTLNCCSCIFTILPERPVIKREMGMRTYSMLSYYLSICISELLELLPFTILHSIVAWIPLLKYVSFIHILSGPLINILFLPSFMIVGFIARNYKNVYYIAIIPMLLYFYDFTLSVFCLSTLPKMMKYLITFFISIGMIWAPNFIMCTFKVITKNMIKNKYIKYIPRNQISQLDAEDGIILSYKIPCIIFICGSILLYAASMVLGIFLHGINIRPHYRMRLHEGKKL